MTDTDVSAAYARALHRADEHLARRPLEDEPPEPDQDSADRAAFAEADAHHAEGYNAALDVVAERMAEEVEQRKVHGLETGYVLGLRRALDIVKEARP